MRQRRTYRLEKPRSENVRYATTSAKRRRTSSVPNSTGLMAEKRARSRAMHIATPTRTRESYGPGRPSNRCTSGLKMEVKNENNQAHYDNSDRHGRPCGAADLRRRGTIPENRLFR